MSKPTLINRRQLLGGTASVLAASMLPVGRALASAPVSGNNLKFVFVMNYGGWDPTRVLAGEFWNSFVDMERDAEAVSVGDLTYVAHRDRPSVDTFFERYAHQSLILKGVQVPSVAHENCLRLMMTGSTSSERADWPAIVGHTRADDFALPHIVIQGPAFPGPAGSAVTRTGSSGQLEGMLSGNIIGWSDTQTSKPGSQAEARMDDYLSRRLAAVAETHGSAAMRERAAYYLTAQERSRDLKDLASVLDWSGGTALGSQVDLAVDALSMGISRCAMLSSNYGWDTHTNNDETQSSNFESLFDALVELMEKMSATPGESSDFLIDETVLVVLSEMGRTPQLNADEGKDHWPYTSVLISGPRFTGGRVVGGYDNYYYGKTVDRATGELSDKGHDLNVEELGATLLLAAGIDPNDHLTGVQGISGVIAD
jgi:uncharacterized protein (DUF1501 family)